MERSPGSSRHPAHGHRPLSQEAEVNCCSCDLLRMKPKFVLQCSVARDLGSIKNELKITNNLDIRFLLIDKLSNTEAQDSGLALPRRVDQMPD